MSPKPNAGDPGKLTGIWKKISLVQKKWTIIIGCIGLLVITLEYSIDAFSTLGRAMVDVQQLIRVADTYQGKVDSVRVAFELHDRLRRNDSARTAMIIEAVFDTIQAKEKEARRVSATITEILIGEMIRVPFHGYVIWATDNQVDPVTNRVNTGYFIHNGEPYEATYSPNRGEYMIRINGKKLSCKDL